MLRHSPPLYEESKDARVDFLARLLMRKRLFLSLALFFSSVSLSFSFPLSFSLASVLISTPFSARFISCKVRITKIA